MVWRTVETPLTVFALPASVHGEMLFNLMRWLDASPAHYWLAAWSAFALVAALSLIAFAFDRERAWWQNPVLFSVAMLGVLLAFRWPMLFDNRQYPDPDESQFIAGALTLRHDPVFWRSVDGTTYGPLVQWPLLAPLFLRGSLDFTGARFVTVFLLWIELTCVWLIFRHLFKASVAGVLVLPLLAVHSFPHIWSFVAYCSEHVPSALLVVGCWALITAWRASGDGRPNLRRLFVAGLLFGAIPFAKLQGAPIAAAGVIAGLWLLLTDSNLNWRQWHRPLLMFIGGVTTVPALIVAFSLVFGVWQVFFGCYILDNLRYAGGNLFPPDRSFGWTEAPRMLLELGRAIAGFNEFALWMAGFGAFGLLFVRRFSRSNRRFAIASLAILLSTVFAAMARGRPYLHYLQLLILPVGLMSGLVAGALLAGADQTGSAGRRCLDPMRAVIACVFLLCGLGPQVWWRIGEPQPFVGFFTANHGALVQSEVSREILHHASLGECLGMWGWMPVFWVETGLLQATRDGQTSRQIEPHPRRDYYRARFLQDLVRSRPPVFVDAVGPGNFGYEDRVQDAHETFPELRAYIADNYHLVGDIEGSRIYVRNDRL